ncbi:MAG TPA: sulfatase-like hydrolase/transferase [Candidatus Polarisedimenticolia bacterium]|nr:sulfatase-like hydrolase/transferase [Candidatus Polarisedimenticolia bacterium]
MAARAARKPNVLVILIDDLRFDEFGAGGHPYMKTPHIDRIAHEGAMFDRAFHTTPICSPNRASILTGQYASRHGIIDNVARDAASHRLPNYHLDLQRLGYTTAHIGKWHMGNDGRPRPGYDHWVAYDGHGRLYDPALNENGRYVQHGGYITDIMNAMAVDFVSRPHDKPWSLFFAHKAVHPDAEQAADGTLKLAAWNGYRPAERHQHLYRECVFPKRPNMLTPAEVVKQKPAWAEAFSLKATEQARAVLDAIHAGEQDEIRLRACMMASVDEGVGMLFDALERTGQLDDTFILFLGDNGYFFGEHGLGPERRFAYEEGIRSPFLARYPRKVKAGARCRNLVICQDIAPTLIELAGGRPGPQVQGRSLLPLLAGQRAGWRTSFLIEYWAENAMPWLVGMSYKAVRTDRHKYIRWVNRSRNGELDELYDLDKDPYELVNVIRRPAYRAVRDKLRRELQRLVVAALGL